MRGFTQELLVITDTSPIWYRINSNQKLALKEVLKPLQCDGYKKISDSADILHTHIKTKISRLDPDSTFFKGNHYVNKQIRVLRENKFVHCLRYFSIMYGFLIENSIGEVHVNGKAKITISKIKSIISKQVDPQISKIPADYTIRTYTK